jgi:hypothetical protein
MEPMCLGSRNRNSARLGRLDSLFVILFPHPPG